MIVRDQLAQHNVKNSDRALIVSVAGERGRALQKDLYAEVERQSAILVGSPGGIVVRKTTSGDFFYRQYTDYDGKKRDQYVGSCSSAKGLEQRLIMSERIDLAKRIVKLISQMKQEGYSIQDVSSSREIFELLNKDAFSCGMVLMDSCALLPVFNHLSITHIPTVLKNRLNSVEIKFTSNKISHALSRGALIYPPDWIDFYRKNSLSTPVLTRWYAAVVAVPEPLRYLIHLFEKISCEHSVEDVETMSMAATLLWGVLRDRRNDLVSLLQTVPLSLNAALESGIKIASKVHGAAFSDLL